MVIKWWGLGGVSLMLYLWVQYLFTDIYNFHCHVDVVQWTEAANSFFLGDYEDVAERDRPLLMLFLSSIWMKQGFSSLDALMLNTRIAWVMCIAIFSAWAMRTYNIRAAIISVLFLLWSHSYSALVLSVAAQIPFNALLALHLFFGYSLARSAKWWSWIGLGVLSCLLPLCKEQGFFFPFLSLFFLLYSSPARWRDRLRRTGWFCLGSAPLIGILFWWQKMIWTHGQKYQELFSDLQLLHGEKSFLGKSQALLNWGSIETTFQAPQGYGDLLYNAWIRLTNEIGVHLLIGLALVILASVVARLSDRRIRWTPLLWTILHILPAIPLFVLLLIEPYHLSFLEIPAAGLLAWASFHIFPNESPLSRDGWPSSWISWQTFGGLGIAIGVAIALLRGQPFFWAMPWEIGSCLTERLIPVMQYVRQNPDISNKTVFVTDNAMRFSKTLPEKWRISPSATELFQLRCEEDFVLITSEKTSGYITMADLFHPNQWVRFQEVQSINNEKWWLYKGRCR